MQKEAERQSVPAFGRHGGIVIDEMSIQDDLVITKKGSEWHLVGMVDMGEVNNDIDVIQRGEKKIHLATTVVQLVFHGMTGFRYWRCTGFLLRPISG